MKIKILNRIKFSIIPLLTLTNLSWYEPVTASQRQISRNAPKIQIQQKKKSSKVEIIEEDQRKEEEWGAVTIVLLQICR